LSSRRRFVGFVTTALPAVVLAACGSTVGQGPSSPQAVHKTCQEIGAVLSDGPDPGADPVGYAFAQVLPLRQVKTSDRTLQRAIDDLAAAYQRFYDAKGAGGAAGTGVRTASARIDALCPGAAS
jgi:hypothetical protein